jgi:hypothetical protein
MAESTLSLTFEELGRSTAFDLGWTRKATEAEGLTASQAANVEAANKAGYREVLAAFDWSWKRPRATFTAWKTATGTVTATSTTATATAAKFFPSMIGKNLLIDVVVNGAFAADTDWTKGAGWTIASGKATATGAISTDLSQTVNPLVVGNTYRVTFAITRTAGTITPVCGTASGTARSTNGTFTEDLVAASTAVFKFSTSGFTGTVDNVKVEGVFAITGYTSPTVVTVASDATATAKPFTVTADGAYRLPDDFGSLYSPTLAFAAGENDSRTIMVTAESLIAVALQTNADPARPTMAGVRPLLLGSTTGQRFDLMLYPITDEDFVLNFRYEVHPNALIAGGHPYGGMKFAELIRKSCLAQAELMFNDHKRNRRDEYALALRVAIADDSRNNRSERLGITRNREPHRGYTGRLRFEDQIDNAAVTVHGVSYDG